MELAHVPVLIQIVSEPTDIYYQRTEHVRGIVLMSFRVLQENAETAILCHLVDKFVYTSIYKY
jgi:hypothetical protein